MYNFILNGKRYGGYCLHPDTNVEAKSKKQARNIEEVIRDRLGHKTNAPAKYGCTLAEAAKYHLDTHAKHLASWTDIQGYARELLDHFGHNTEINSITDEKVAQYVNWSREQTKKVWMRGARKTTPQDRSKYMKSTKKTRAPGTINKYLKVLKQFFNTPIARRHCKNPPQIRILKEPQRQPSPITHESAEKILKVAPLHLQNLLVMCMHTGMREHEALTLKTSQFNEDLKTIYLDTTTKTKNGRQVLVNDEASQIIKQCRLMGDQLWEQLQSDSALAKEYAKKYSIKNRGDIPFILYRRHTSCILRPIDSVKSAWYKSLRTAGLEGQFRFHDSRASFCSYLAQAGSNPLAIRELVGHKDIKTTMRYIGLLGNANQRAAVDGLSKTLPFNVKV